MLTEYAHPESNLLLPHGPLPTDRPFTAAQVPVPPHDLGLLVQAGFLRRPLRGVYVASALPDTLGLRARSLSLVVSRDAVVTDRTAAWLHGVDVLLPGEQLEVPPICVFHRKEGCRVRRPEVAGGKRALEDTDVQEIEGVLVTTPLRTACDLAMVRNRDRAFGALEAMLHAGVDKADVEREMSRFKGRRFVRAFRDFVPWADSRSDSIAESITRLRWLDSTAPYPEPQRPVRGPHGEPWSLDMGVDELYFAVEYDGEEFHGPDQREYDDSRRRWIGDSTPWIIWVVRKANVFGPHRDFELLLPGRLAEARRTLPDRLRRGRRWYEEIGD